MAGDIVVIAEHREGELEAVTLGLIAKGQALAAQKSVKIITIVIGHQIGDVAKALSKLGVDEVVVLEHSTAEYVSAGDIWQVTAKTVDSLHPSLILMGYNYYGIELGPALATHLGKTLVSNCVDVEWSETSWRVTRLMYDGRIYVKAKVEADDLIAVSLQPAAIGGKPSCSKLGTLGTIRHFDWQPEAGDQHERLVEVLKPVVGDVDISKAEIIVAAGRGVGGPENLKLINELATTLGGVVACSRPLVDLRWMGSDRLVGLSGTTVLPKVYIACGISGAAQHISGMCGAERIIAINKDADSPIFQVAHYGIVGDLFQIVPSLIQEAKSWTN